MLSAVELSTTRVGFRGDAVGAVVKTKRIFKPDNVHRLILHTSLRQLNNNRTSIWMLKGGDNSYSAAV